MKIVTIVGARPQFIKAATISRAFRSRKEIINNQVTEIIVHTGQHYDQNMSKVFFNELNIPAPHYNLGVKELRHGAMTGKMLERIEALLLIEKPDSVLVYGDTNSTLAGALAASKLHMPVSHVEAGLRSFNMKMPEEINRILTDHVSSLLFCPSESAVDNLKGEGIVNGVCNVGDVMYDALLYAIDIADKKSTIMDKFQLETGNYYFLTLHRSENTDNAEMIDKLIRFVNEISENKIVIFPMHPRTKKSYLKCKRKFSDNIRIIDPVGYFDVLTLLKNSALLMTDSGGIQKEAFWLKIPCITLRRETEWLETVESGWNVLYHDYAGMHTPLETDNSCYGDGRASEKILNVLLTEFVTTQDLKTGRLSHEISNR